MEEIQQDNLSYLGKAFQSKTIWQLLTDKEFCDNVIDHLTSSYFDDEIGKRIITEIKNYYKRYGKPPSLTNHSMEEAVNIMVGDEITKETIHSTLAKLKNHDKSVKKGLKDDDREAVQEQVWQFVKQQKYKILGQYILKNTLKGNITIVDEIEAQVQEIFKIGQKEDLGTEIFDDIDDVLETDFRNTIPTGINAVDELMGGGLGNGEMGFVLAGLGTGKTTILSYIANNAHKLHRNVLQIFFEDMPKQIKRKHYAKWSGVKLSEMDDDVETVRTVVKSKIGESEGKLVLKKFGQEDDITIPYIKKWILNYQKITGIRFDMIVLDYIDCVECHDRTLKDPLEKEIKVVKAFEAMLADLNIPGWSAIQGNRSSLGADVVNTSQMGGNIKKAQKTHFLMSIARTDDQKESGHANMKILKSRFGRDGITFDNAIFDNNAMEINIFKNNHDSMMMSGFVPEEDEKNLDAENQSDLEMKQKRLLG